MFERGQVVPEDSSSERTHPYTYSCIGDGFHSNYAPTIQPAMEAGKKGFQQILWLLDDYVTEVGTMNLFCFWISESGQKELITAPLDGLLSFSPFSSFNLDLGTILPGVTRKTIIELAQQWNEFKITERKWTIHELVRALEQKRVLLSQHSLPFTLTLPEPEPEP